MNKLDTDLTARMCMGCDRRTLAWGASADRDEEGCSGETWLSPCNCWSCRGWLCCAWRWWWCEEEVCPLCSSGADSVCWPLQEEYRLSSEEFISLTRASKSTSSSDRQRWKGAHQWRRNDKETCQPSKEGRLWSDKMIDCWGQEKKKLEEECQTSFSKSVSIYFHIPVVLYW